MSYSFRDLVWVRREPRAPGTCPVLLCSGRPFPLRVRREEQRINPPLSGAPLRGELSPLPGNTHVHTHTHLNPRGWGLFPAMKLKQSLALGVSWQQCA